MIYHVMTHVLFQRDFPVLVVVNFCNKRNGGALRQPQLQADVNELRGFDLATAVGVEYLELFFEVCDLIRVQVVGACTQKLDVRKPLLGGTVTTDTETADGDLCG